MSYIEWVPTLTDQQLRAFAAQFRVPDWQSAELPKLRKRLLSNEQAKAKYQEHFGEAAGVPKQP